MKNFSYFLAANSSKGFFSLFDELYDPYDGWNVYIIKGGPGTGKSGMMRKIINTAKEKGYETHQIFCSSDPDSLDGIIIPELKVSIADGTAPHILEPKYPGIIEKIINLGDYWDDKLLKTNYEHIITLTDCNKTLHSQSSRYLSAAGAALRENINICESFFDHKKTENYIIRLISRNISSSNAYGKEKKRFISAITPKGKINLTDELNNYCDNIITITDEYSAVSGLFMNKIRQLALANGIDIITFLNPIEPLNNPEHIIFEKEKIGFFTANKENGFKSLSDKNINVNRFINKEQNVFKNRINFNKKTYDRFIKESIDLLSKAKSVHDELESYYITAMDFDKVNEKTNDILNEIF